VGENLHVGLCAYRLSRSEELVPGKVARITHSLYQFTMVEQQVASHTTKLDQAPLLCSTVWKVGVVNGGSALYGDGAGSTA
jgi:hypothetical protein